MLGRLQKGNSSQASELALKYQPAPKLMLSVFTLGCFPMQRRDQMSAQHLKAFCVPCRHRQCAGLEDCGRADMYLL